MLRTVSFRRLLLLPALLLLLAPAASLAQPAPAPAETLIAERAVEPPPAADTAPELSQLARRLYLPALRAGPTVKVTAGTGYNSATGQITGAATSFAYGVDQLFVQTEAAGADGLVLRQSFTFTDGQVLNGSPRTVLGNAPFVRTTSYCITTGATCQSGRLPLDRGTYVVQVYLNDLLVGRFSIVIR